METKEDQYKKALESISEARNWCLEWKENEDGLIAVEDAWIRFYQFLRLCDIAKEALESEDLSS